MSFPKIHLLLQVCSRLPTHPGLFWFLSHRHELRGAAGVMLCYASRWGGGTWRGRGYLQEVAGGGAAVCVADHSSLPIQLLCRRCSPTALVTASS